jgi:hypothetical protein
MSPAITATRTRTLGGRLACAAGLPHTLHDRTLPAAARTSIRTAPKESSR